MELLAVIGIIAALISLALQLYSMKSMREAVLARETAKKKGEEPPPPSPRAKHYRVSLVFSLIAAGCFGYLAYTRM